MRLDRRAALWHALPEQTHPPLLAGAEPPEPPVEFPSLPPMVEIPADYAASGLSLRGHPLQFLREALSARRVTPAAELVRLPDGDVCSVAGLVLVRQRPGSARGVTFMTVEDETGTANLVVWPDVWERHHAVARGAQVLLAHGCLQRQGLVTHLVVDRLEDASTLLPGTDFRSRDFH